MKRSPRVWRCGSGMVTAVVASLRSCSRTPVTPVEPPRSPGGGLVLSSQASFQDFVSRRPLSPAGGEVFQHEV